MAPARPLGWRDLTLGAAFYGLATLALAYPLSFHPASLGRFDNGDARLNAWGISWVSHQLLADPLRLFEANIFHPLPHTLAFSEHLTVPGLLALPLLRATNDLVLTYNLLTLFSIWASAFAMYLLVLSLTGSRAAALVSGLSFSITPYRFDQLPHLQMQLYGFLPLALAALHRFFASGQTRWALTFAACFVLQALSGTYLAAMTAVAASVALLTLGPPSWRSWHRGGLGLVLAGLLIAAVIFPFARPYLWVHRTLGIAWDLPGIASMSATPLGYLSSSSHVYRDLSAELVPEAERTPSLFPGLTILLLSPAGLVILLMGRGGFSRPRANAFCYLLLALVGFLISLGPGSPLQPLLYEHVLFFRGLRALWRFALLPLLGLSVLTGYALAFFFQKVTTSRRHAGAFALLTLLAVAESTGVPYQLEGFRDEPPPVYSWLVAQEPGPIVELPFRVIDTRYMFWARHHGFRPMLNGDSGFIPPSHQWMQVLFRRFPSPDALRLLQQLRVRYVIVHLGAYRPSMLLRLLNGIERYRNELVPVRDFGRDLVFEVLPSSASDPKPDPGAKVTATGEPASLFDGDRASSWPAPEATAAIEIRLERESAVAGIRIVYGPEPRMPADRIEVETKDARGGWRTAWATPPDWPGLTEVVLGLLAEPPLATQTLTFSPLQVDTLRLRVHGLDGPPEMAEVEVLSAGRDQRRSQANTGN